MRLQSIGNSRALILGCGREGWSVYHFLRRHFPTMKLAICDQRPFESFTDEQQEEMNLDESLQLYFGEEWLDGLSDYNVIIKSPGVNMGEFPQIQEALFSGGILTSPTNIFLTNTQAKVIGVTGTKGKSTAATLLHRILEADGRKSLLLGNIGAPALDHFEDATPGTLVVMELSSYQLETVTVSPPISLMTSFFPDHLDYHGSLDEYFDAKAKIIAYQNQLGTFVYNGRFKALNVLGKAAWGLVMPYNTEPGCRLDMDGKTIIYGKPARTIMAAKEVPLPGRHNLDNAMGAATVARLLEVPPDVIRKAIIEFTGLPHRLQHFGTYDGIDYFDDAISTAPDSTIEALEYLGTRVGGVILGGSERHQEYEDLADMLTRLPLEAIVFQPDTGLRIKGLVKLAYEQSDHPEPPILDTSKIYDAVEFLRQHVSSGRAILLSPAAPSYTMYDSFEERGDAFQEAVKSQVG